MQSPGHLAGAFALAEPERVPAPYSSRAGGRLPPVAPAVFDPDQNAVPAGRSPAGATERPRFVGTQATAETVKIEIFSTPDGAAIAGGLHFACVPAGTAFPSYGC